MRTNDERIFALHRRTAALKREKNRKKFAAVCAVSTAVCIAVLVGMAVLIPRSSQKVMPDQKGDSLAASIFSGSPVLGTIVVAILAFLLGITITVFCFRLKKWLDEQDRDDL